MTPAIQNKIEEYKKKFILKPGNVIELGSFNVNGGVRHIFNDADDYVGLDMSRGPGVDIVANIHEADKLFEYRADTILCLETLEHDNQPWLSVEAMRNLLIPGGFLVISTPLNGFPEHRYPKDYFRYLKDSYTDWFFDGYDILDICEVYHEGYGTICGIAKKPFKIRV